jgi:hypothetical protein
MESDRDVQAASEGEITNRLMSLPVDTHRCNATAVAEGPQACLPTPNQIDLQKMEMEAAPERAPLHQLLTIRDSAAIVA